MPAEGTAAAARRPLPRSPMGRLLTVHAHPDDETLANGALIATWAAAGAPVTVVTCTRGEQGEVIGDDLAHLQGDGPALAAHRERELAAALEALGVTDHVFLDQVGAVTGGRTTGRYVDSGMAWVGVGRAGAGADLPDDAFTAVDPEQPARDLAALILDRRPAVVVCDEPGGGYGHPDHVRAHRVVHRAVELAALAPEPVRVPVVLWTAVPEPSLRAAYAAIGPWVRDGLTAPDPTGPVPSVAVDPAQIGVVVEVRPVLDRVLGALRAHRSQVTAVVPVPSEASGPAVVATFALSNGVLSPVLGQECYRFAGGEPVDLPTWPPGVRATVA